MNPHPTDDVLIVGAGPAGLALSVALAQAGFGSRVFEQHPLAAIENPAEDGREIALTHRARRILEQLGIWQRLPEAEISPLREARVSDGVSPFVLPFDGRAQGAEQLGWLVPNFRIRAAAYAAAAEQPQVTIEAGAAVTALARDGRSATLSIAGRADASAPLVVAADSRFSTVRRMAGIGAQMLDFGRIAIVTRLEHDLDHGGVAHECFRYGNTLATLPLAGRSSSAVLTLKADEAPAWLALDGPAFAARIEAQLGGRLGPMRSVSPRHHYPLVAVFAHRFAGPRFALVGDAAVGMHPVTAHGYNFGLYGIETLARALGHAKSDPRAAGALAAYATEHRRITWPVYTGTNTIVRLFTDDRPPAKLLRSAVLRVARGLPPVRELIARQLTGGASARR